MRFSYFKTISALCAMAACQAVTAQTDSTETAGVSVSLTLDDAVARARASSVDASVALTTLRSAYWEWRSYKASLLPEITFTSTIPALQRRYSPYQHDDGSYSYVRDDNILLSGEISLSQRIWPTGGTVSLSTSLDFRHQLGDNPQNRFMTVPVSLTLNQPVLGFNDIRWARKVEPVKYREACAEFISQTEEVAMSAITYFFNLVISRQDLSSARLNLANAEKMLESARAKHEMGRISRNDLLQIEQINIEARLAVTAAESDVRGNMFRLRSFLGMGDEVEIVPVVPDAPREVEVTYGRAIDYATERNSFARNIMRRQLEADREVARANAELRQINVFASIGVTGTDVNLSPAYRHLGDNQVVTVGISLPLVDWGKRRGKVKMAKAESKLMRERLAKETQDFNQELFVLVERHNNQAGRLKLATRAVDIARTRYDAGVETFLIGKISTLDLADAQQSKDNALRSRLSELYYSWYYYYRLRSITLWDFATDSPIDADIERVLGE